MTVQYILWLLLAMFPLTALDIAQKRASLEQAASGAKETSKGHASLNKTLAEKKDALKAYYESLQREYYALSDAEKISHETEQLLLQRLQELNRLKNEVKALEEEWKSAALSDAAFEDEGMWHQPDTTIGQLVIDYGSTDSVYLMPPEIGSLKVHVSSQLSVPRAMWSEMLGIVLANYGIGIKQLNTFIKQLYFLRLDQSSIAAITDSRDEISLLPQEARICFVLQPPATELSRTFHFIERFVPQEQMVVQVLSNSIVVVGYVREIQELLKVYDFVAQPKQMQEYRLVALQKAQSEEVAKILQSIFEDEPVKAMPVMGSNNPKGAPFLPPSQTSRSGFRIITLKHPAQSLFLLGNNDQIEKALKIIEDIENKIGEVQDKVVHWYACKHSEAEELAEVLSRVYITMINSPDAFGFDNKGKKIDIREKIIHEQKPSENKLVVNPPRINPGEQDGKKKSYEKHDNFIVDNKTNSIVLVVESYILPKMKELLKKLDVPKKMVQIDVLLFEKRVSDNNSFGLNLLRMGNAASDDHKRSLAWNHSLSKNKKKKHHDSGADSSKGVLAFLISRHAHGWVPAYDLAYSFLLAQEDIQINANPTVTCVNQTAAKIAVVEQISINTGVVEIDTTKATRLKDSYTREEYGITIQITPTIHSKSDDEEEANDQKFVHLATDVVFDTTRPSKDNRPDVTRRNIKNEVRVADGETVILGGLRRKIAHDNQEMMPFLGELPGIGKLFSNTMMSDSTTEMFIFITPRIVPDKSEEFRKMRQKALLTRPGDVPEFLYELLEAQSREKQKLFEKSLKLLFGKADSNTVATARTT